MLHLLCLVLWALLAIIVIAIPLDAVSVSKAKNGIRTLSPEEKARKRGVAYNNAAYQTYFNIQNTKVAWMYNWDSAPGAKNTGFEYIPMLHSDHADHTAVWDANVKKCADAGTGAVHVLSFNEPDGCGNGGACMTDIGKTVAAHKQWVQPLKSKYGSRIYIASPAVTNGGSPKGLAYLNEFLKQCTGCTIDYAAIHWYDKATNIDYFKNHLRAAHDQTGKMVWITEFGPSGSEDEIVKFLENVLPWMDSQDWIYRYAYFMAAPGLLVTSDGRGLSRIGQVYATL